MLNDQMMWVLFALLVMISMFALYKLVLYKDKCDMCKRGKELARQCCLADDRGD